MGAFPCYDRGTPELVFATFLAPCIRPAYQLVADRVGESLGQPAHLVVGESFEQLHSGEVDFAFICGLPYVRLRRQNSPPVNLVAAPVIEGSRYGGRPIYFSDVIVPAASPVRSFEELRGKAWACNGFDSHSGTLVVLHRLLQMGETGAFFGRVEVTGSHYASIQQVADGLVDGSAIDSQILAVQLRDRPELGEQIRVITSLGPSTMTPLVAAPDVPESLRSEVCELVAGLGKREVDRNRLGAGLISGFARLDDAAYDDIRGMLDAVESARLRF
ncbi:MAG: PhnD/SsuA/transferrin family substrate-binding protein [Candidatus Dormibacteraeota bacterium]|nr:PhnD/SsuA/transferrin family substrate-binding protein [Candidatus Dormibacteraeota bacterium]